MAHAHIHAIHVHDICDTHIVSCCTNCALPMSLIHTHIRLLHTHIIVFIQLLSLRLSPSRPPLDSQLFHFSFVTFSISFCRFYSDVVHVRICNACFATALFFATILWQTREHPRAGEVAKEFGSVFVHVRFFYQLFFPALFLSHSATDRKCTILFVLIRVLLVCVGACVNNILFHFKCMHNFCSKHNSSSIEFLVICWFVLFDRLLSLKGIEVWSTDPSREKCSPSVFSS